MFYDLWCVFMHTFQNNKSIPNIHGVVLGLSAVILSVPYDMPRHGHLSIGSFKSRVDRGSMNVIPFFLFSPQLASEDCHTPNSILQ